MPIDYDDYPANWKTYIRPEILKRAENKCEGSPAYPDCRAANKEKHPVTGSKVILTIAHLDHIKSHNDGMDEGGPVLPKEESNLRAWCQRCHLTYDAPHKAAKRRSSE